MQISNNNAASDQSNCLTHCQITKKWSGRRDLNPRPLDPQVSKQKTPKPAPQLRFRPFQSALFLGALTALFRPSGPICNASAEARL